MAAKVRAVPVVTYMWNVIWGCNQLHCLHHAFSWGHYWPEILLLWLPDPWRWRHYIQSQHHELLIQQHSVIITWRSESSTKPLWKPQILHRKYPFPSEKSTKNYILTNNTATSLSSWWLHTSLTNSLCL
jgi:hypothetical protein